MQIQIGAHRTLVEDDVLLTYVSGPLVLAELTELLGLCEQTAARLGSVYLVTIVGPGFSLPLDSRKYAAEWGRGHALSGNVIVGAPFAMRALITILARAAQLVGARSAEVVFTATEAEARAYITQHKRARPPAARPS